MTYATRSPLICVGKNIHLEKSGYNIAELYIAPGEQLLVVLDAVSFDDDLMWKEVTTWDYDTINEICEEYTYATTGQSYRLIDLLIKYGFATFSSMESAIDLCKETIKNKVHVASRIIPESESHQSAVSISGFIKKYASAADFDCDSLIETVFTLDLIDGVSIKTFPERMEIHIAVGDSFTCPLLTLTCNESDVSACFTPADLHSAIEANGLFPHEADKFLNQYAAYIDTSRHLSNRFDIPAKCYHMDLSKLASDLTSISSKIVAFIYSIK